MSVTRYAYLGPQGTFTEAALHRLRAAQPDRQVDGVPAVSVAAALAAVRSGDVDAAVVPIENSVEGGVSATLDGLVSGSPVRIVGEVLVPVVFVLAAREPMDPADLTTVATHPHAHAQCRDTLARVAPQAQYVPASSTAAAAADLSLTVAASSRSGVVCAPLAAQQYGLATVVDDVADRPGAVTRFVVVARPVPPSPATGADRTTVVAALPDDRSGGLLEMLEQFAARGVNLSRIESRPVGDALGRYSFSIDCWGHVDDAPVAEALTGLHRVCPDVVFLGSYPRADATPAPSQAPGDSAGSEAFAAASAWLDRIRRGA